MRKGLVDLSILAALSQGEDYGYGLLQRLAASDTLASTESTVYPALARLAKHGYVQTRRVASAQGPKRKYYRLTPEGRAHLRDMLVYWRALDRDLGALLTPASRPPDNPTHPQALAASPEDTSP